MLQAMIDARLEAGDSDEYFTITLYQMEMERIKYSLAR
jgi:hypothetical protein